MRSSPSPTTLSARFESMILSPDAPTILLSTEPYRSDEVSVEKMNLSSPACLELESDLGLSSPMTRCNISTTSVSYSDLVVSVDENWTTTPVLGAFPHVSSNRRGDSDSIKQLSKRRDFSDGTCASISEVLSHSEETEIRSIDIFRQEAGVGLGLTVVRPVSQQSTLAPVEGDIAGPSVKDTMASRIPPSSTKPSLLCATNVLTLTPSPIMELPERLPMFQADTLSASGNKTTFSSERTDLGLDLHSLTSASPIQSHFLPVSEEKSVATKAEQHKQLGRGLPTTVRSTEASFPSDSPTSRHGSPLVSRIHATMHNILHPHKSAHKDIQACKPERQKPTRTVSESLALSPVMLLAVQSVMEEERRFRKKEGCPKASQGSMSPTRQMLAALEDEMHPKSAKTKSRFLF